MERRAAIRLHIVREHFGLRHPRRRTLLADPTNPGFCCMNWSPTMLYHFIKQTVTLMS